MTIPNNLRVPWAYIEFDSSKAVQGSTIEEWKVLIVGQKLSGGTKAAGSVDLITNADKAREWYGAGSVLHKMIEKFLKANTLTQLYVVALDDAGAGVEATGSVSFTGPCTKSGTVNFYIGGKVVQIAVAKDDTAIEIASALNTAINADSDLMITSAVDGTDAFKLNFTSKHKGEIGNQIDLRFNYYNNEELPSGVGATIVAFTGGTTNPDMDTVWPIIGDEQYKLLITPYTDASNLGKIETELLDRFGPLRQIDGYHITSARGTVGELQTLGESRNSQFTTIVSCIGPNSPWDYASAVGAKVSYEGSIDPARPFQTLQLIDILPGDVTEEFTLSERNTLLWSGIATVKGSGTVVRIERLITTYKTNESGADDVAYLDLNTLLTLSYLRFDFRNTFLRKYPRHKLSGDGVKHGISQKVLTPNGAKAEAVAIFRRWEELALVEDADAFKQALVVERNTDDVNRLDFIMEPNLVNQLRVVGATISFIL